MALVGPLAMATGVALEQLATAEGCGRKRHDKDGDGSGMNAAGGSRRRLQFRHLMQPLSPAFINQLRFNEAGLIPAIAQDWLDGAVLMMAWMNQDAIEHTLQTGEVHYWSRSRQELWHKGATSGYTQTVRGIRYDCDADVLLISIDQTGDVACHTGSRSCFYEETDERSSGGENALAPPADACTELFRTIEDRQHHPEAGSYTNKLLEGGDNRILKKVGEESAEFVMACKDDNAEDIAGEAADIIFHLQVAMAHHGVPWRDVQKVLAERRGAPRRH